MLVLSRREEQVIVIDHRIKVHVIQIRGDHVRIGIEAPDDVDVNRLEVEEGLGNQVGGPKGRRY